MVADLRLGRVEPQAVYRNVTGNVTGNITHATGAAVPKAKIIITRTGRDLTLSFSTSAALASASKPAASRPSSRKHPWVSPEASKKMAGDLAALQRLAEASLRQNP
jgi:hypothetical protein